MLEYLDSFVQKTTKLKRKRRIITITGNNFYHFFYNTVHKCLFVNKTKLTSEMTEDQYKEQILNWLKINIKYHPEKILVDNSCFDYIIVPELQKWVNDKLLIPSLKLGLKKIAFVNSPNIFTDVSIRQAMEEQELPIEFAFFETVEEAKKWLNIP